MDKKIVFFIDGFNLYHALDHNETLTDKNSYQKYKWLNLQRLAECFAPKQNISEIYYFTAFAIWSLEKMNRHKIYIAALRSVGIKPVYGNFKLKDKKCPLCKKMYQTYEEKQTDVNIAIYLFQLALKDEYDTAIVVSGEFQP